MTINDFVQQIHVQQVPQYRRVQVRLDGKVQDVVDIEVMADYVVISADGVTSNDGAERNDDAGPTAAAEKTRAPKKTPEAG